MVKIPDKIFLEATYLNLIKDSHSKPQANTTVSGEWLKTSTKVRNEAWEATAAISVQFSSENLKQ